MSRKTDIFEAVLTSPYNHNSFVDFVREFLNDLDMVAPTQYKKIYNNFSYYVDGYYHIGNYQGDNREKIAVFSVALKKGDSVERSRTMQRNFIKPLIEAGNCAGALVAFYTPEEPDKWRLSFIRLDYEFSKGKVTEKLTPAKRYSYLVGKGEPCNTAKQRLFPIFQDDTNNPGIDDLEEAFSVEKVTNEFFQLYCEKYHELREYLESNEEFMQEAQIRNFTSEQFAKKLMGQIVFLYFIQKKGWLGVAVWPKFLSEKEYNRVFYIKGASGRIIKEYFPKLYVWTGENYQFKGRSALEAIPSNAEKTIADNMVNQHNWGNGDKEFVRTLYNWAVSRNMNFFDDCLEPLFYETLNKNRGEMAYCLFLHCRIPFLNGGLFEQLDNYEWENNNFAIPNELFSNKAEKGRDADGILDIFDRYNFTMNEDEPMEREVAIDPEVLGKVFENLLDVKDRKSKGAFYTPREIVHYMCQETLINHLVTKTGISENAIRDFILYGEYLRDEDTVKTLKVTDSSGKIHYEFDKNKDLFISEEILSYKKGVNRLKEIDDLLANVKVADLAVGSGAFPLGMLNEIVRARQVLTEYLALEMNGFQKKSFYAYERKTYTLKVKTIKNCIFACDIEPSAVDIAKLRLWLSIVIDDEIEDDAGNGEFDVHTKPRQLPNLDCNIICGNSLVDEFMGNKLITESLLLNNVSNNSQGSVFQQSVDVLISKLIELQDNLFSTKEHTDKEEIKQEIQKIYDDIILEQIGGDHELRDAYFESTAESSKPFILWQLYFPRVFKENGGFDIVIGNPPYVQLQAIKDKTEELEAIGYKTYSKTSDLYCIFHEKGLRLLRKGGILSYITSNKWLRAGYGSTLRSLLIEEANPFLLIDFAGNKVFETASVDVDIICLKKEKYENTTKTCIIKDLNGENLQTYFKRNNTVSTFSSDDSWIIFNEYEIDIKNKLSQKGKPLEKWKLSINYGIKTGFNDAYIVDDERKNELVAKDDRIKELFKPVLRGRDIKKFSCNYCNLWLIAVHNGNKKNNVSKIDIEDYPVLKEYFDTFGEKLKNRSDKGDTPYNLRNCAYMDDFKRKKIVYPETTQGAYFYLDDGKYYLDKTCFFMVCEYPEYLAAVLSSELYEYAYKRIFSSIELGGSAYQYNKKALLQLPVIPPQNIENDLYVSICEMSKSIYKELDEKTKSKKIEELDELIYDLYDISVETRMFIKEKRKMEG